MILRVSIISTMLLLALSGCGLKREGSGRGSCGLEPSAEITYTAPTAEGFKPTASVLAISSPPKDDAIEIEASVINAHGLPQTVRFSTANLGRTWVRKDIEKDTESARLIEFSMHPMRYRFPLTREYLERSSDDGKLWRRALVQVSNSPTDTSGHTEMSLRVELAAVHPMNPNTLYGCLSAVTIGHDAIGSSERSTRLDGIYLSTDGGDHWSIFSEDYRRRSFDEPCVVGINPRNPNIMLIHGRSGLVITRDGGKTWKPVGDQLQLEKPAQLKGYAEALANLKSKNMVPPPTPPDWVYLVLTGIVFEPNNENGIYLVTNKGVYKTSDCGRTWFLLNTGLDTLFGVGSLMVDESNPARLFVGSGGKIFYSKDGGCHFVLFVDSSKLPIDSNQ